MYPSECYNDFLLNVFPLSMFIRGWKVMTYSVQITEYCSKQKVVTGTSSPLHSLSYMDRERAGSMLHMGSTLIFLSPVRAETDRELTFNTSDNKEIPEIIQKENDELQTEHSARNRTELTIFSFRSVVWGLQILLRCSIPSNTVLVCFNLWLLENRTQTGNTWLLVESPILSWLKKKSHDI